MSIFFWSLWDIELYIGICCFHTLLTDNTPIFFQEISFSFESSWPWILVYSSPKNKRTSPSTSRWTQMKNWTQITSTSVTSTGNFCTHAVFTSSPNAQHTLLYATLYDSGTERVTLYIHCTQNLNSDVKFWNWWMCIVQCKFNNLKWKFNIFKNKSTALADIRY